MGDPAPTGCRRALSFERRAADRARRGGATLSTAYEFTVGSHLDCHWTTLLAGLALALGDNGTSTLTGAIADQSELHRVLAGLRGLGAPLLAVRRLPDSVVGVAAPLADLTWAKRTERLALRPAGPEDVEPTWRFRRLEPVCP